MSASQRHGDLEIVQDARLQEIVWAWQRFMWIVFAGTILLALLGLFGGGPIGRTTLGNPGGRLVIEYDRFSRIQSPSSLDLEFRPLQNVSSRIWVNRDYVERAGFQPVSPTPEREIAGPDGTTFVMAASPVGRPVRVRFRLNPEGPGFLRARVRLDDGPEVGFTQVVYP
jgi:hypothetical protein